MAEHCLNTRNMDKALEYFKESLKYDPNNTDILTALSRVHLQMNSTDLCRNICLQMLEIDTNNEAAAVMMADISFRKLDFKSALYNFSQLLLVKPCYWTALARLIEVMRRTGTLDDGIYYLQRAEILTLNPEQTPGLNYCRGLYDRYCENPNSALRYFNSARKDIEWGSQALFHMIEICANPDGKIPNGIDMIDTEHSIDFRDARSIALRTADRLLKELRKRPMARENVNIDHQMLHLFLKLASMQKYQVESALQDFIELSGREELQNKVGPLLGISTALVLLKQLQRAKTFLKRIARMTWNFDEAEYFERGWLLLVDIYVTNNKWDLAEALVAKVIKYNKSSKKAHELAGHISEKTQLYAEASNHYNNAWRCCGRSCPHIGYKLAYNYMKTKHFAEAIEICQNVLKIHPAYTIIRNDILDKCRVNLRM